MRVEKESLGYSVEGWRVTFKGPNMVTYGIKYREFRINLSTLLIFNT